MRLQSALRLIYPPQCLSCAAPVSTEFALCSDCWREMQFAVGTVCDTCGISLPGEAPGDGAAICDDCLRADHPWVHGRSAFLYEGTGRRLILALKHGDRPDLARPMAGWLARSVAPIVGPKTLIAPVPAHWRRLFQRRYNQAALVSAALAAELGCAHCPDLLTRVRATGTQDGKSRESRIDNVSGAIAPHPRRGPLANGRPVLLIDDVMTTGATLGAATQAALAAGARSVSVATLARVAQSS